ncbi:proline hydroxylase [bacterium]|nr:proline hydroxylase [bacterium]
MFDKQRLQNAFEGFLSKQPFPYCVIDDFFPTSLAEALSLDFPEFNDPKWHEYKNSIEIKKISNNWNIFPKTTYDTFCYLNSMEFTSLLSELTGINPLLSDPGLNGGGWHIHANGGKLNPHLDYSMHPKIPYQRKLNLIVYMQPDWQASWGGHLGVYEHDKEANVPGKLIAEIEPRFNRAIFFDTTMDSWHGLCKEVATPAGICRKSLAVYYLTNPPKDVDNRGKALFAPTQDQKNNKDVLDLIKKRSQIDSASSVYK